MNKSILYMTEALKEAESAFERGEVPVGAVLVLDDEIIARASNRVEELQDATAHAEMLCLKQAAQKLENWRLQGGILYTTLEPCPMCAGASILSRVKKIIWGAPDLRQGADGSWMSLLRAPHPIHQVEVEGGVLAEESSQLMRRFFKERRLKGCGCVISRND